MPARRALCEGLWGVVPAKEVVVRNSRALREELKVAVPACRVLHVSPKGMVPEGESVGEMVTQLMQECPVSFQYNVIGSGSWVYRKQFHKNTLNSWENTRF